jgi:hypothetical protein
VSTTPWEDHLARQRGHELCELSDHWGEAYEITWASGMFRAERRDNQAATWAATADELRALMRDDYLAKPVPYQP